MSFKSKTDRFKELLVDDCAPPPGHYVLKSSIKNGRPKVFAKPYMEIKGEGSQMSKAVSAPAIPSRSNALGYETLPDGTLARSHNNVVGFAGQGQDRVGPFEYDPKLQSTGKYKSAQKVTLKGTTRASLDRTKDKHDAETPGPGYYNHRSSFDMMDPSRSNDTDFVVQLGNTRKQQSSVFESKTLRDSFIKDAYNRIDEPGPGSYHIPPSIQAPAAKPVNQQCFTSAEKRFKDITSRSLRINTAPGDYNVASSTDQLRYKIMKQKKMTSRSGWAQTIAFTSTEGRFNKELYDNHVPPPSAYVPKTAMADKIPTELLSGGGFGGLDDRFKEPKMYGTQTRDQKIAKELNDDIAPFLAGKRQAGSYGSPVKRPEFTCNFAPNAEDRFKPAKTPPGPPPGSYEVNPSWKVGSVPMVPPTFNQAMKRHEVRPGPGDYQIVQPKKYPNRKKIMISNSPRVSKEFKGNLKGTMPGPGTYNPEPLYNNMLKSSHNILLSSRPDPRFA